jgi:hypothetical protein
MMTCLRIQGVPGTIVCLDGESGVGARRCQLEPKLSGAHPMLKVHVANLGPSAILAASESLRSQLA